MLHKSIFSIEVETTNLSNAKETETIQKNKIRWVSIFLILLILSINICKAQKPNGVKYDSIAPYSEGLAAVKINDKWGYIDENKNLTIPIQYDGADKFYNELAIVCIDSIDGIDGFNHHYETIYIDKTGKEVKPFVVADTTIIFNDLAITFKLLKLNGKNDGTYDAAKIEYERRDIYPLLDIPTITYYEKDLVALGYYKEQYSYFFSRGKNDEIGFGLGNVNHIDEIMAFFRKARSYLSLNPRIKIYRKP